MVEFGYQKRKRHRKPTDIPEEERDYYLERRYPAFGNLVPRDVASVLPKNVVMLVTVLVTSKMAVYLDFKFNMMRYGRIEKQLNVNYIMQDEARNFKA
jgi:succinate dehydrogenase / fumarate reductase flavoprotein subunit